jgi:hypothetical protein
VQRESEPHEAVARAHVLRLHAKRYEALTSARILPPNWRLDTLYDLSRCPHTTQAIVNIKNDHGSWDVVICVDCGVSTERHCPHELNSWNEDGTILTCDNCGIDGT